MDTTCSTLPKQIAEKFNVGYEKVKKIQAKKKIIEEAKELVQTIEKKKMCKILWQRGEIFKYWIG